MAERIQLKDRTSNLDRNVKGATGNPVGQNPPSQGDYFRSDGKSSSPFDQDDHLKALLENKIVNGGSYDPISGQNTYNPANFTGNLPAPADAIDTFPDFDGLQGPQFQKAKDIASQAHISSLSAVPGGDSNSPFQDRNDGATPTKYIDNLPS